MLVVISAAVVAGFALFLVFRAAQARISRQTEALLEASRRDPLTDLLNHGALVGYLAEEIERARRSDLKVRVALVDLDNFRLLNDNHGHRAGDEVLLELAELLRERLPADLVRGRYGPDEFLLIAPAGSEVELRPAVEHLRQALAELTLQFEATERLPVTVSAGLCAYPEHGTSVTVLLATAASALGEAKASGGDAVREAGESQAESSVTSSFDVLQGLVFAVDTKDRYTRRHSEEVARYAEFLGAHLELDDELMRSLHIAGLLHDVGKIGIPDHILRKPGRLTAEEADVVKQHVALGDMIVRELPCQPFGEFHNPFLERDPRSVAQERACQTDVGETVPYISHSIFAGDLWLDLVLVEDGGDTVGDLDHRVGFTATDVEHSVGRAAILESEPACLGDVIDAHEIALLAAVFEDQRRPVVQITRSKNRQDARVWIG